MLLTQRSDFISSLVIPNGLFQYTGLQFGMKSAQATFQRMVNTVIKNLDFSLTYVYNLILCSDSCEDHLTHLYHTFGRLSQSDFTVILGRLIFFRPPQLII